MISTHSALLQSFNNVSVSISTRRAAERSLNAESIQPSDGLERLRGRLLQFAAGGRRGRAADGVLLHRIFQFIIIILFLVGVIDIKHVAVGIVLGIRTGTNFPLFQGSFYLSLSNPSRIIVSKKEIVSSCEVSDKTMKMYVRVLWSWTSSATSSPPICGRAMRARRKGRPRRRTASPRRPATTVGAARRGRRSQRTEKIIDRRKRAVF